MESTGFWFGLTQAREILLIVFLQSPLKKMFSVSTAVDEDVKSDMMFAGSCDMCSIVCRRLVTNRTKLSSWSARKPNSSRRCSTLNKGLSTSTTQPLSDSESALALQSSCANCAYFIMSLYADSVGLFIPSMPRKFAARCSRM